MRNKLAVLKSEILRDLEKLDRLFEDFSLSYDQYKKKGMHAYLVESAFYVNQIYSGFERIFSNVATLFENSIDEIEWHKSLVERMALDIEDIRPAVISGDNFNYLNELRAFRHFFRHSYGQDIDREKFSIVATRTLKLKESFKTDIEKFIQFIDRLLKA